MKILSFDIGTVNLAYCYVDYTHNIMNIIEWDCINLVTQLNKIITPYTLTQLFELKFNHILPHIDTVLIENQPPKNSKMKTIQTIIHTYFVCKLSQLSEYHNDKNNNNNKNKNKNNNKNNHNHNHNHKPYTQQSKIVVCNPREKYAFVPVESKNTYYKRKKTSVQLAMKYLDTICTTCENEENNNINNDGDNGNNNHNNDDNNGNNNHNNDNNNDNNSSFMNPNIKYFTAFMDSSKKDDLADSLLQIKVYVEKLQE